MTGMHHMLVHFPIAFWALATLLVVGDTSLEEVIPLLEARLAEIVGQASTRKTTAM